MSLTGDSGNANETWAAMLTEWAIPGHLVAAAAESPYFFSPSVFTAAADAALARAADTPSDTVAREALPAHGTVLDVGVGAGAASLRLDAEHIVGVDPNPHMLDAFVERATRRGITATAILGGWPDVETQTPTADVVLCHHVAYNVADLARFASALSTHAARRVVIELTAVHPLAWMAPYWQALHDLTQPDRPTADDAATVLREIGLDVHQRRWQRAMQMIGENDVEATARLARRLCLPADRHGELVHVLARTPPPTTREVVTMWWDCRQ